MPCEMTEKIRQNDGGEAVDKASALNSDYLSVITSRFGEIEVSQEKIITMTSPILGFPKSKRFVLRPHREDSPFMWLQSLDEPKLAFVVTQPALVNPQYQPGLGSHVREELGLDGDDQPDLLVILAFSGEKHEEVTVNLLGPIVINAKKRLAKQVILDPVKYDPCWPVTG